MENFIMGAIAMASGVVALFFLRFWRQTGDRFFVLFAAAFAVLMLNWVGLGLVDVANESRTYFYALRLVAFSFIILAIWDKNRSQR